MSATSFTNGIIPARISFPYLTNATNPGGAIDQCQIISWIGQSEGGELFRMLMDPPIAGSSQILFIGTELGPGQQAPSFNISTSGGMSVRTTGPDASVPSGFFSVSVDANFGGTAGIIGFSGAPVTLGAMASPPFNSGGAGIYTDQADNHLKTIDFSGVITDLIGYSGRATLVAGTVTVSNVHVTATSDIFLTAQNTNTSGIQGSISVATRVNATSFTIKSSNAADTSIVSWFFRN